LSGEHHEETSTQSGSFGLEGYTRMSDGIAELRERHALAIERIHDLDSSPRSPHSVGRSDSGPQPDNLRATARQLWDAKLVQIHRAALLDGVQLYPLDGDRRCSSCGLHVPTLQHMEQDGHRHQLS
jgi:hypothetical protein